MHGLVLAAGLTAVARYFGICLQLLQISHRLCHGPSSPPTTTTSLRAAVFTNLRQYCSPAPKNGVYTAPYEETYNVPPIVDSEDLWRLAHQLSMQVRFISTFTFFLHFGSNFHFLISLYCSTTQRSQRGNLSKSCECFPRCSPLREVEMLHSGEITMMIVEEEEIVFDGDVTGWVDDGH